MKMIRAMRSAAVLVTVVAASAALAGCPTRPSYPSTITPIYALTATNGLYVYNGSSWTNYSNALIGAGTASGVAVFGSGTGAEILVSGTSGVRLYNGSSWGPSFATATTRLTSSAGVYASTASGLSMLNPDGSWSTNASLTPADAFSFSPFTYVATGSSVNKLGGAGLTGTGTPVTPAPTVGSLSSVCVDALGDIAVGGATGLAVQFSGMSTWNTLSTTNPVTSVYADVFGDFYATTSGGLYIVNIFSGTAFLALSGTNVQSVCVDGAGVIYAGTANGLQVSKDSGATWTPMLSTTSAVVAVTTTAPLYSF